VYRWPINTVEGKMQSLRRTADLFESGQDLSHAFARLDALELRCSVCALTWRAKIVTMQQAVGSLCLHGVSSIELRSMARTV
jgi:hypothetical protein